MVGHAWAVDLLGRHLAAGRPRHAYLFIGPAAVGKRTLALRLAQRLNCLEAPEPGAVCGTCRVCRLAPSGNHPDLHIVARAVDESALKIDAVRALQHQLALAPHEARWRLALLPAFHLATLEAQHALLKTLEEPPPRVILLLTAETAESVLPTIVSRCETISLRSVPAAEIAAGLRARGVEPAQATLLASLANGRPGRALQLAEEPDRLAARAGHLDSLWTLLRAQPGERFGAVEGWVGKKRAEGELEARRRGTVEMLEAWLGLWRDALLRAHGAQAVLANPDRAAALEALAAQLGEQAVLRGLQATAAALEAVHRNANLQLALETLAIDLPRLPQGAPAAGGPGGGPGRSSAEPGVGGGG